MVSVHDAAQADDRRETLVALRNTLALSIDVCESMRDLASLSNQLTVVLAQISEIPNHAEVSNADEIAARRAKRRTSSPRPARVKSSG
jgi:hypothetical protein